MKQLVVALSALFLSVILFASGNAMVGTLLGVRLSLAGVEPMTIGSVLFFYALGFVIGTRNSGKFIQRVGHIRAFAVFAAIIAIAALIYPISSWLPLWALLRFLTGIAAAGLLIAIESWFSCVATEKNRGTLFATYQICFYLAVTGGQLLLQLSPPELAVSFSYAAMLLVGSLIPLAMSHMHSPALEPVEPLPMRAVFREAPLGIVAAVVNGILMSSFYAMGPVYTTSSGLSVNQTAIYMAVGVLSATALAWPVGHICDNHQRSRVLLGVSVVSALAAFAVLFVGSWHFHLLCALNALYLGLAATLYPIAVALTNDRMDSHQIVAASASLLAAFGIGSIIGPLLSAAVMSLAGNNSYFAVNGAILLLLIIYTLRHLMREPPTALADQESFVTVMPGALPTILELDPRNEGYDETDKTLDHIFASEEGETDQTSSGT